MSDWIKWILALVLIWFVGLAVIHLVAGLIHTAIIIAVIGLLCYLVYSAVRAASRQKI